MASVTPTHTGVKFVLELDEAEAQYVEAALRKTSPTNLVSDPVWNALEGAMHEAGVACDSGASA